MVRRFCYNIVPGQANKITAEVVMQIGIIRNRLSFFVNLKTNINSLITIFAKHNQAQWHATKRREKND